MNSTREDEVFSTSNDEGLQCQFGRNFFQLAALAVFSVAGITGGFFMTNDRPVLASLVGGFVGTIVGTFVSGFVLMFIPTAPVNVTLRQARRDYRLLQRRFRAARIVALIALLALFVLIALFGHDGSFAALILCVLAIAAAIASVALTHLLNYRLATSKCPRCCAIVGENWSVCPKCGLSID